jgi:hypothetical protein
MLTYNGFAAMRRSTVNDAVPLRLVAWSDDMHPYDIPALKRTGFPWPIEPISAPELSH